ncbi:hypothetical protein [Paludibacterium denitrificans]|uniref:Uncharacterized protein n=1 Tax=Paludibacterium denitrificans TaxID=2675226 RepID=A0A844GG90_9NEIS|nr:hypothetical protein [Paludibacterium denitrificans]MTD33704.1 hypothetical protein [Paludibacterium denitrificans]
MKMGTLSVLLIAVIGVASAASLYKKHEEKKARIAELELTLGDVDSLMKKHDEFNSITKIAASTPRIQLSPLVARMQDMKNGLNISAKKGCSVDAKLVLDDYIKAKIDSYIAFMGAMNPEGNGDAAKEEMYRQDEIANQKETRFMELETACLTGSNQELQQLK